MFREIIENDKTGVADIIFSNFTFRTEFEKKFLIQITSEDLWNTDTSIFYIEMGIRELNNRKKLANAIRKI